MGTETTEYGYGTVRVRKKSQTPNTETIRKRNNFENVVRNTEGIRIDIESRVRNTETVRTNLNLHVRVRNPYRYRYFGVWSQPLLDSHGLLWC